MECPTCGVKLNEKQEYCFNCGFPVGWYYSYVIGDDKGELLKKVNMYINNEMRKNIKRIEDLITELERVYIKIKEREKILSSVEIPNIDNISNEKIFLYYNVEIVEPEIELNNNKKGCLIKIKFNHNLMIDGVKPDLYLPDFTLVMAEGFYPTNIHQGKVVYKYSFNERKTTSDEINLKLNVSCKKDTKFRIFKTKTKKRNDFALFELIFIGG